MIPTDMPAAVAALPRDKHGRPVPWFVAWIDGAPDFRVIRPRGIADAYHLQLCWVCGERRDHRAAFVIGPMCAVNRVSAEPPSHLECATFSALTCPFLTTPNMRRRDRGKPANTVDPAGVMLTRNPGAALVWLTRTWRRVAVPNGHLFDVGEPLDVWWFAQGRPATRGEVLASIESGLPVLQGTARAEGKQAVAALDRMHRRALRLVPA
jgi:hypothetical protein